MLLSSLRAILFDFDGTLIDSFPAIAASVNHVRGINGLAPLDVDAVKIHIGRGPNYLLRHTVGVGNMEANLAAYRAHHPSVLHAGTTLLPGAKDVLVRCHARGLKLGICSNKPVAFTRSLVDYLGVATYLDVVVGPEDVRRHKPAPDMLLAAMERIGVTAEQTLYIGDMTVDIEAARAAGVLVWVIASGVDSTEKLDRARPDYRLENLSEVGA